MGDVVVLAAKPDRRHGYNRTVVIRLFSSTILTSLNPVIILRVPIIVALSAALVRTVSLSHVLTSMGWAEATHVDTARGEKRFEYLRIKLHSVGPAACVVKRVFSVSNASANN